MWRSPGASIRATNRKTFTGGILDDFTRELDRELDATYDEVGSMIRPRRRDGTLPEMRHDLCSENILA